MESDFHRDLKRQAADYFTDNGWQTFQEFVLPDRTIADVFAYCKHRGYTICEVSPLYTASKATSALHKYRAWCNRLYLAAPSEYSLELGEGKQMIQWIQEHQRIGIISLSSRQVRIIRTPATVYLHPRATRQLQDRIDRSLKRIDDSVLKPTGQER